LKGSRFQGSNLSFASFENTSDYSIDPRENIVKKMKVSLPEAIGLMYSFGIDLQ
jgi:hypothetical protein